MEPDKRIVQADRLNPYFAYGKKLTQSSALPVRQTIFERQRNWGKNRERKWVTF